MKSHALESIFLCLFLPVSAQIELLDKDNEINIAEKVKPDMYGFFEHIGEALLFVMILITVFAIFVVVGFSIAFVIDVVLRDILCVKNHIVRLVVAIVKTFFIVFGIYASFYFVHIELVSAITGLGVTSLIVGYALSDLISNFAAGIIIEWCDIIKDGSLIRVAYYGTVAKGTIVRHRTFHLEVYNYDFDELYYVPNAIVMRFVIAERNEGVFVQDRKDNEHSDNPHHNARTHDTRHSGNASHRDVRLWFHARQKFSTTKNASYIEKIAPQ